MHPGRFGWAPGSRLPPPPECIALLRASGCSWRHAAPSPLLSLLRVTHQIIVVHCLVFALFISVCPLDCEAIVRRLSPVAFSRWLGVTAHPYPILLMTVLFHIQAPLSASSWPCCPPAAVRVSSPQHVSSGSGWQSNLGSSHLNSTTLPHRPDRHIG